jgi:hypothetical protein
LRGRNFAKAKFVSTFQALKPRGCIVKVRSFSPKLFGIAIALTSSGAWSAISTTNLSAQTPADLVNALLGAGVSSVSNVSYTGAMISAGSFVGGTGIVGFESGVVLSTGDIASVAGPNVLSDKTTVLGLPGDADLSALSGFATFDASVLEFDFVPNAAQIFFRYVFSSEEYNEYVNSPFNDAFAFLVSGGFGPINCAVVGNPPVPITINTINNGPLNDGVGATNSALYINNNNPSTLDTEMDGLTVVVSCEAIVTPFVTNHIKLAIADGSDLQYDSNVFIEAGSFTTTPPGSDTCPLSQGYWKTHGSAWPVSQLTLGSIIYQQDDLLSLLAKPVKGDASISLAKQLIAAKLNLANGTEETPVESVIASADTLIGASNLPMGVKSRTALGRSMTQQSSLLDSYNNGKLTSDCSTLEDQ